MVVIPDSLPPSYLPLSLEVCRMAVAWQPFDFNPADYPHLDPISEATLSLTFQPHHGFHPIATPIRWVRHAGGGSGRWAFLNQARVLEWNGELTDGLPIVYRAPQQGLTIPQESLICEWVGPGINWRWRYRANYVPILGSATIFQNLNPSPYFQDILFQGTVIYTGTWSPQPQFSLLLSPIKYWDSIP